MSKSKVFIGLCLNFSAGVFAASVYPLETLYLYWLMGASALVLSVSFSGMFSLHKYYLFLAALFLFFLSLGALRFNQSLELNGFKNFFGNTVSWEAYVVEDPDVRADKQLLSVRPKGFQQEVLITTTKAQEFFYGDWLLVQGKVKQAEAFDDFDYPGYLRRFGVYALLSYPKIIILKNGQSNAFKLALLKIKSAFANRAAKFLPEPQNSLALGILIGARRGLPLDVVENFNATGISHIVAVSGFNISVIVVALGFSAWLFGRNLSFWLSSAVILGFIIISGGSASVIRASFMGALLLFCFSIGRLYAAGPALIFVGAAMLFINPKILYWDVGFQLSFAATLGLVYFMPLLEKLTDSWPKVWGLKSVVLATMTATLTTLPLILWYFGRLSTLGLLANLLVLPLVPFAMLFGFLVAVPFLAPGFAFLAHGLLSYILWVAKSLASAPFASVEVTVSPGVFVLMAAVPFGLYFFLRHRVKFKSSSRLNNKSVYDRVMKI